MCSARSITGWTVIWASGLAHQSGPARRSPVRGPPGPGPVRRHLPRALDGGVFEVDVQHHLTLTASAVGSAGPLGEVEGGLVAGQVAGRDGAAHVQGLGGAGQQLLVGISGERGVEVDARRPGPGRPRCAPCPPLPTWARSTSIRRASAAASRSASAFSGSNRAMASSISRPSCAGPIVCANATTAASTNPAACGDRHMVRSAMNPSFHAARSPASSRAQHHGSR